jgi:hypothetical protein
MAMGRFGRAMGAALIICATSIATDSAEAQASRASTGPEPSAIQVIADVTAIQTRCWNLVVRPGVAFAYGETKGVRMIEVLPGGRLRGAFDRAFAETAKLDNELLCGAVAYGYANNLPGVIERRP